MVTTMLGRDSALRCPHRVQRRNGAIADARFRWFPPAERGRGRRKCGIPTPKSLPYSHRLVLLRKRPVVMDTDYRTGAPRKRHVLILDDDISLAWSLKETLELRGYE